MTTPRPRHTAAGPPRGRGPPRSTRWASSRPTERPGARPAKDSSAPHASLRGTDEVADTAHRADEIRTKLAAQLVDVDRHRVALDLLAPAVQPVLELGARQQCA